MNLDSNRFRRILPWHNLLSSSYFPADEFEINPLDPAIRIEWGLPDGVLPLSSKDAAAPSLSGRAEQGKLPGLISRFGMDKTVGVMQASSQD